MAQPSGLEPGVYLNLDMDKYHDDPAVGGSDLKAIMISDEEFWQQSCLNPNREHLDTNAFKMGRAYHSMVLEPEKPFPFEIKDHSPDSKAAKEGKILKTTTEEGKIGRGDYNDLLLMYHRLLRQPAHWNALHGGFAEVSIFWRDPETGLMCKCRPDNFSPDFVGDLKTAKDISDHGLYYDFPKMMYPLSGYRYSRGCMALRDMIRKGYQMPPEFDKEFIDKFMAEEKQTFFFVLQEKTPPFSTRLWAMTPFVAEEGASYFIPNLQKIKAFYDNPKYANITEAPVSYPAVEKISEGMIYLRKNF